MNGFSACVIGQWSPANPTGFKKYDREFLLNMKFKTECVVKPKDLPDMPDIVLDSVSLVLFLLERNDRCSLIK